MVNILATVRDEQGRWSTALPKKILSSRKRVNPREIEYFSSETDLPLTLGLLVDTSMSQSRILEEERQASYQFLEDILRPESDLAFVMSFDVEAQLLENLTNSQKQLLAALESLHVPTREGLQGVGTVLYDSVFLAADEILKFESGRKAMIVISDGVDFGSIVDLDLAIETAQRQQFHYLHRALLRSRDEDGTSRWCRRWGTGRQERIGRWQGWKFRKASAP